MFVLASSFLFWRWCWLCDLKPIRILQLLRHEILKLDAMLVMQKHSVYSLGVKERRSFQWIISHLLVVSAVIHYYSLAHTYSNVTTNRVSWMWGLLQLSFAAVFTFFIMLPVARIVSIFKNNLRRTFFFGVTLFQLYWHTNYASMHHTVYVYFYILLQNFVYFICQLYYSNFAQIYAWLLRYNTSCHLKAHFLECMIYIFI